MHHMRTYLLLLSLLGTSIIGLCLPPQDTSCGFEIGQDPNPTGEGLNCYKFHNRIVANDFEVPAGEDWIIQTISPNLITENAENLEGERIYFYNDNNGKPGALIQSVSVEIISHSLTGVYGGKNVYTVTFDLNNLFLPGRLEASTTYWMGFSSGLSTASFVEMEVSFDNMFGKPVYTSSGGEFQMVHPDWEGVFSIEADCVPITDHTGPNEGYCETPAVNILQDEPQMCFSSVTSYVGQSFTATVEEMAGMGIKLEKQSRGHKINLALWDKLPSQNGSIIDSMTTYTYGEKWVDVFWENPVALTPGQKYYMLITGEPGTPCVMAAGDVYSGGSAHGSPNYIANWDYDLTFRVYGCYEEEDLSCIIENRTAGWENAHLCSKNQSHTLATDIHTTAGYDFLLEEFTVHSWTLPGNIVVDCDITLHKDDNGKPGDVIIKHSNLLPVSKIPSAAKYGYDIEKITFQIPPQLLAGNAMNTQVYWASFKLGTTNGDAYLTTDTYYLNGHPLLISENEGVDWQVVEGTDMSYVFSGQCIETDGTPCEQVQLDIEQNSGMICMTNPSPYAVQSFTATSAFSTGAGVKFFSVSNGFNLEISLWDGLPNAGGEKLTSKTKLTNGNQWIDILWDHKVPTTPGEEYYLIFDGDDGLPCLLGTTNNMYDGGHVFRTSNYEPEPDWSLVFRTYGCADEEQGTEPDCEEEVANDFSFNSGLKISPYDEYLTANDLTVQPGEMFTLTAISANVFAYGGIHKVDVLYYDDNGGYPGNVIGEQNGIALHSQKVIGEGSGLDVNEIKFYVEPFEFYGDPEETTTYWISLRATDMHHSTATYWQTVTTATQGNYAVQKQGSNPWETYALHDGVYKWEGNCSVMVGTTAQDFEDFSYFPNPASAYIEVSNPTRVEGIEIYNALGQRVNTATTNNTSARIDISSLQPGIYFMQVAIGNKRSAYKFIKE